MKKRAQFIIVLIVLMSLGWTTIYGAESDLELVIAKVDQTNIDINNEIDKAIEDANRIISDYDNKISMLVEETDLAKVAKETVKLNTELNDKLEDIIEKLISNTNKMAADAVAYGEKRGFTIICELIEVEIGGRSVWIDPLRVTST